MPRANNRKPQRQRIPKVRLDRLANQPRKVTPALPAATPAVRKKRGKR